jgi:hypothetical protein
MSNAPVTARQLEIPRELNTLRPTDRSRAFFVGLGVLCIVLVIVGFGPNLYRYVTGQIYFPPIVHVHAAIMMAWVVVYTTQASLAARGNLKRHRRVGWVTTALAAAVWVSMGVAIVTAMQRLDPDRYGFIVKPILVGFGQMVVFPVFVGWAVLARRREGWHKRLMTFATFALVQAALDRMNWLPNEGLPPFWHAGLRGYVLLMLPLFIFDFVTLRRIHPATWLGSSIIVVMHGVVSFYWNHEGWNRVARGFWMWVR